MNTTKTSPLLSSFEIEAVKQISRAIRSLYIDGQAVGELSAINCRLRCHIRKVRSDKTSITYRISGTSQGEPFSGEHEFPKFILDMPTAEFESMFEHVVNGKMWSDSPPIIGLEFMGDNLPQLWLN